MLGKLIKYEILSGWKKFAVLYAAAVAASLMMLLTGVMDNGANDLYGIMESLIAAVWYGLVYAIVIMTVVFVVHGFYKSMLKDEGYLTHTLPVPEWQILAAKLLAGYIWYLAMAAVLLLCFFISCKAFDLFGWRHYDRDDLTDPDTILVLAQALFLPLLIMAKVFFSFALGNLSNAHKLGISVLAFFGISIGENILTYGIARALLPTNITYTRFNTMVLVLDILLSAAELVIAERIFTKRLNLE